MIIIIMIMMIYNNSNDNVSNNFSYYKFLLVFDKLNHLL